MSLNGNDDELNGYNTVIKNTAANDANDVKAVMPPLASSFNIDLIGSLSEGSITSVSSAALIDTAATFTADGVTADLLVINKTSNNSSYVTAIVSAGEVTLSDDIFTIVGEDYGVYKVPKIPDGFVMDHGQTYSDSDSPFNGEKLFGTGSSQPIRQYRLNEQSGTNHDDTGSAESDATSSSASVGETGKIIRAVELSSDSETLTIPTVNLTGGTSFTFAWWENKTTIHASTPNNSSAVLIGTAGSDFNLSVGQKAIDANDEQVTVSIQDGASVEISMTSGNYTKGSWKHFMLLYDGITGNVYFYINNVLIDSDTYSGAVSANSGTTVFQGGQSARTFTWLMDDIRYFDRFISEDERAFIYNAGTGTEEFDAITDDIKIVRVK